MKFYLWKLKKLIIGLLFFREYNFDYAYFYFNVEDLCEEAELDGNITNIKLKNSYQKAVALEAIGGKDVLFFIEKGLLTIHPITKGRISNIICKTTIVNQIRRNIF